MPALFAARDAVIDPVTLEQSRRAFIIRGDINRTDHQVKWRFLHGKHGYMTQPMPIATFKGVVSVPFEHLND